jgi:hypothetical protein
VGALLLDEEGGGDDWLVDGADGVRWTGAR